MFYPLTNPCGNFWLTTIRIINTSGFLFSVGPEKKCLRCCLYPPQKRVDVFMCQTLKETSLDPDHYLLRRVETVKIDLASSLGIPVSATGSVESWVEQVGGIRFA